MGSRIQVKTGQISRSVSRQLPITEFAHKAAVVGNGRVGAVLAAADMAAESCGPAVFDGVHHLQLAKAHMASIGERQPAPKSRKI